MASLRIAIADILTDPDEPEDLSGLPAEELGARLQELYRFLGPEVDVSIDGDVATILVPDAGPQETEKAERMCTRAVRAAERGQYKRATRLLGDMLQAVPMHEEARRNLGMAYMEAGDAGPAKKHLIETLENAGCGRDARRRLDRAVAKSPWVLRDPGS